MFFRLHCASVCCLGKYNYTPMLLSQQMRYLHFSVPCTLNKTHDCCIAEPFTVQLMGTFIMRPLYCEPDTLVH